MLTRGYRCLKQLIPPPLEAKIPPEKVNYNHGTVTSRAEYIRTFKEDACLRELPFLMDRCGLTPQSALLDYGCGFGRLAYAASNYLSDQGAFFGYEPNQAALNFLRAAYADRPNFRFAGPPLPFEEDYVAVRYGTRPASSETVAATELDLSFVNRAIKAQWTSSVFSHMWAAPIIRVLESIGRLMDRDGLCVNTWICIDEFAAYALRCGVADRALPFRINGAHSSSESNPLACTGYELSTVREIYEKAGHRIEDILWGKWSGRENGVIYLDVIISRPK